VSGYDETNPRLLSKNDIKEIQQKRLRRLINYVYENSPYYRKLFQQRRISPEDIKTVEDLRKLPFTTKEELRDKAYPYGGEFLAVPFEKVVRFHMTSGTTGIPTVNAYTTNDIEVWSNLVARCLKTANVNKNDIMMNIYGYGLFTGGIGLQQGAEKIGVKVIPWSAGRTEGMVKAIKDFKATVITGTPSYELVVAETIKKLGIDPTTLNLRLAIPGAEAMTSEMLKRIESELALKEGAREIYGFTEAMGPGVSQECPYDDHKGMHIWTDHFIAEIVDPETGEVLDEGEEGELVITTLSKEAVPLIRYRTRDITKITESDDDIPYPKISIIKGRIDDVIFYKGVKIYPSAINLVLMKYSEIAEYQVVFDRRGNEHKMILKLEVENPSNELKHKIVEEIRTVAFVTPEIEFIKVGSLPRFEGKSKRVIIME